MWNHATACKAIIRSSVDTFWPFTLEPGRNVVGTPARRGPCRDRRRPVLGRAFINTGQTSAALKRLYVHDAVCEEPTKVARLHAHERGQSSCYPDPHAT
jgi:phenylacetaldehyde dehydrogenase